MPLHKRVINRGLIVRGSPAGKPMDTRSRTRASIVNEQTLLPSLDGNWRKDRDRPDNTRPQKPSYRNANVQTALSRSTAAVPSVKSRPPECLGKSDQRSEEIRAFGIAQTDDPNQARANRGRRRRPRMDNSRKILPATRSWWCGVIGRVSTSSKPPYQRTGASRTGNRPSRSIATAGPRDRQSFSRCHA